MYLINKVCVIENRTIKITTTKPKGKIEQYTFLNKFELRLRDLLKRAKCLLNFALCILRKNIT